MDYIVKNSKKRFTLAPVYVPNVIDSQNDWADADTIEKAAWDYMRELQKGTAGLNDMHRTEAWNSSLGEVVECYCAPADMRVNGKVIKAGTWLLGAVWTPEMFRKIEAGKRIGYSMEGTGTRS